MKTALAVFKRHPGLWAALAVCAITRAGLLSGEAVPFNADEAVVALMARHILAGERPLFFYGQAYLGSLDAWLVAGMFRLIGESVLAVRVVQIGLYLATITSAYALALTWYRDRWLANLTALWLAAPPVLVVVYTTASLGGYGEALLIGNLLWLAASHAGRTWPAWAALGFLTGLGLWVFPLTGVYALPAWAWVLWRQRPLAERAPLICWALAAGATLAGAAPWLWATLTQGPATLAEMGGAAIAGVSGLPFAQALLQRAVSLLLFAPTVVAGLRAPWGVALLALPLAPLALAVYGAALFAAGRRQAEARAAPGQWLLGGTAATLGLAFVLTPFGSDPSGRYFLPLALALAFVAARWLAALRVRGRAGRWLATTLGLGLVTFNLWGVAQSAAAAPRLTTQFDPVAQVEMRDLPRVAAFLRERGETRGYANYWVTFPLAFLSREDLVFAARLPYHLDFRYTPRDDRYPAYTAAADAADRTAYIVTRHPPLEARLRAGLAALNVAYQEERLGDFTLFYGLTRPVRPAELGLGAACCP